MNPFRPLIRQLNAIADRAIAPEFAAFTESSARPSRHRSAPRFTKALWSGGAAVPLQIVTPSHRPPGHHRS